MTFNITSGPTATAQKVVLYGVEGIGKSTFASQFPNPVFIDTEGSTSNMNIQRLDNPNSWQMLIDEVNYVKQTKICSTLIIDTADWAETLANKHVIARNGITSIEDLGYGKGYTMVKEEFGKLLNLLSELTDTGINVVVTAHAELKKKEEPDQMGAYDRYQLKLSRQCAPLLKEWSDMVLFANYETTIVTDSKTKSKKATGGQRVMFTTHHPAWDAKNRHNLPEKLPFDFSSIAQLFQPAAPVAQPEPTPVTPQEPVAGAWTPGGGDVADTSDNQNQFGRDPIALDPGIDPQLAQLMTANGVTEDEVKAVVVEKGFMPPEVAVKDYPTDLVQGGLVAQWANIYAQITAKRAY
ncbi:ATP-binding protein [Lactococcus raffinolactis]|uniref:ATP-binding protein n=1 Tax=Pseudolactococcus raffinolactis TaxID=1366 RepID=UPI001C70971A|nr:ATP-binding protein [Lactococcus raffinolactis]MBW9329762.1 ATP-binding protein [Lactococcus raffinolactis]